MADAPIKLTKDGETREVTSPAEQVRLEWNGWRVASGGGEKKSKAASGGGGDDK